MRRLRPPRSTPRASAVLFVALSAFLSAFVTLIVSLIAHYIWGWLGTPSMVCPACQHGVDLDHVANHCPHCGAAPVSHVGLYDTPFCKPCGRELTKEDEGDGDDGRTYSIRYCTHCGLLLDEQGL